MTMSTLHQPNRSVSRRPRVRPGVLSSWRLAIAPKCFNVSRRSLRLREASRNLCSRRHKRPKQCISAVRVVDTDVCCCSHSKTHVSTRCDRAASNYGGVADKFDDQANRGSCRTNQAINGISVRFGGSLLVERRSFPSVIQRLGRFLQGHGLSRDLCASATALARQDISLPARTIRCQNRPSRCAKSWWLRARCRTTHCRAKMVRYWRKALLARYRSLARKRSLLAIGASPKQPEILHRRWLVAHGRPGAAQKRRAFTSRSDKRCARRFRQEIFFD